MLLQRVWSAHNHGPCSAARPLSLVCIPHGNAQMNYRDYLATTTHSSDEVLGDWQWLIGTHLVLWHVTKAGDAFLRDPADGSIHMLDTVSGNVERIAADELEFESRTVSPRNAGKWLMPDVVEGQAVLGMRPGPNECLSFSPPALGGQLDPDNFESCNIPIHFSIAGQIHRQIKNLPPGTPIDIKIEPPKFEERARGGSSGSTRGRTSV